MPDVTHTPEPLGLDLGRAGVGPRFPGRDEGHLLHAVELAPLVRRDLAR